MPWTVVDAERLDRPTAVALAFLWASMHVRHVVVVKTVRKSDMKGVRRDWNVDDEMLLLLTWFP